MASRSSKSIHKYKSNPMFEVNPPRIYQPSISSFKESYDRDTSTRQIEDNPLVLVLDKKNEAIAALRAKNQALLEQNELLTSQLETLRSELSAKQAESLKRIELEQIQIKDLEQKMVFNLKTLENKLNAITVENVALKKENCFLTQKLSLKIKREKKNVAPVEQPTPRVRIDSVSSVQLKKIRRDQEAIDAFMAQVPQPQLFFMPPIVLHEQRDQTISRDSFNRSSDPTEASFMIKAYKSTSGDRSQVQLEFLAQENKDEKTTETPTLKDLKTAKQRKPEAQLEPQIVQVKQEYSKQKVNPVEAQIFPKPQSVDRSAQRQTVFQTLQQQFGKKKSKINQQLKSNESDILIVSKRQQNCKSAANIRKPSFVARIPLRKSSMQSLTKQKPKRPVKRYSLFESASSSSKNKPTTANTWQPYSQVGADQALYKSIQKQLDRQSSKQSVSIRDQKLSESPFEIQNLLIPTAQADNTFLRSHMPVTPSGLQSTRCLAKLSGRLAVKCSDSKEQTHSMSSILLTGKQSQDFSKLAGINQLLMTDNLKGFQTTLKHKTKN